MPLLEDILLRFRRVWAPPGPAAGQPGVPTDLAAGLDDELRDLTVELAAIAREGQAIVQAAEAEARSIVDSARSEAVRIVEAATVAAPQLRTQRAAEKIRDRRAEIDRLIGVAQAEATTLEQTARARMQPVIERVVSDIFAAQPAEEQHARVVGGG